MITPKRLLRIFLFFLLFMVLLLPVVLFLFADRCRVEDLPPDLHLYGVYPWEATEREEIDNAITTILTQWNEMEWVRTIGVPGRPTRYAKTSFGNFVAMTGRVAHYWDTYNLVVFFDPETRQAYGLMFISAKQAEPFGNPPEALARIMAEFALGNEECFWIFERLKISY